MLVHPGKEGFGAIDRFRRQRIAVDGQRAGVLAPLDARNRAEPIGEDGREMGMNVERDALLLDGGAHEAADRRGDVASTGSVCTNAAFAAATWRPGNTSR